MDATDTEQLKTLLTILAAAGVSKYYRDPASGELLLEFHQPKGFQVIPQNWTGTTVTTENTPVGDQYHELFGGIKPSFNPPKKAG